MGGIVANDTRPAEFIYDNLTIETNIIHAAWKVGVEKLLFLVTGNFGVRGGNNFHSMFIPIIGHSPDGPKNVHTRATDIAAICNLYPPNVLPAEIESARPDRVHDDEQPERCGDPRSSHRRFLPHRSNPNAGFMTCSARREPRL